MSRPVPSFRVLVSDQLDPYRNLATEEWLLDRAADEAPVLFLWQSAPAVIIGKNQNPWCECDTGWMHAHEVLLARRVSGGGAVYHDEGNLNYAFFMPRTAYRAEDLFAWIAALLADLGFAAERMNRTSLAVEGLKVSGNAFCFRRNAALHHGTLLIDSDLAALKNALRPSSWTFDTRATASIRSRVRNLSTPDSPLSVQQVRDAFMARCGAGRMDAPPADELSARTACMQSEEWLFRQTPPFTARFRRSNTDVMEVAVENGLVTDVTCRSKSIQTVWNRRWLGGLFDPDAMRE